MYTRKDQETTGTKETESRLRWHHTRGGKDDWNIFLWSDKRWSSSWNLRQHQVSPRHRRWSYVSLSRHRSLSDLDCGECSQLLLYYCIYNWCDGQCFLVARRRSIHGERQCLRHLNNNTSFILIKILWLIDWLWINYLPRCEIEFYCCPCVIWKKNTKFNHVVYSLKLHWINNWRKPDLW